MRNNPTQKLNGKPGKIHEKDVNLDIYFGESGALVWCLHVLEAPSDMSMLLF